MAIRIVIGTQMARMLPGGERAVASTKPMNRADHDVADDEHHQIGRQVVGAVVVHLLAAMGAGRHDAEEGRKQLSLAAFRAFAAKAVPHRVPERTGRAARMMLAAENLCVHFYLLLRPRGWEARERDDVRPFDLWNDFFDPGSGLGSLNISKRMAPASGATSTSRTSTRSAS